MTRSSPLRVQYSLAPLVRHGRDSLACRDVDGLAWVVLEEVEFYHGGFPWQRVIWQSDDIFALLDREIIQWPTLDHITRARFALGLTHSPNPRQITLLPPWRALGRRDAGWPLVENWMRAREFLEVTGDDDGLLA